MLEALSTGKNYPQGRGADKGSWEYADGKGEKKKVLSIIGKA
jgi:hypothetical protein